MDDLQEAEALEAALDALGDSPTTQQILDVLKANYRDAGVATALKRTAGGGGGSTPVSVYTVTAADVTAAWSGDDLAAFITLVSPVPADLAVLRAAVIVDTEFDDQPESGDTYAAIIQSDGGASIGAMQWNLESTAASVSDGWTVPAGNAWGGDGTTETGLPVLGGAIPGDLVVKVGIRDFDAGDPPTNGSLRVVLLTTATVATALP